MNDIVVNLESQEWYTALIDELKSCIVETEFNARDAIIQGKHFIGKEILKHEEQFSKAGYLKSSEIIATSLGKSQRDIEQCIQFARKYPDLDLLPIGKNYSWHKITQELLPEHTGETTKPLTKQALLNILREIKILLQHELDNELQSVNNGEIAINKSNVEYIRYLQDQFNKLIGTALDKIK